MIRKGIAWGRRYDAGRVSSRMRCEQCGQETEQCGCVGAEDLMGFLRTFREVRRPTDEATAISDKANAAKVDAVAWSEVVLAENVDGPEAGWYPDPTGEFPLRWWNGAAWTAIGSDDGLDAP